MASLVLDYADGLLVALEGRLGARPVRLCLFVRPAAASCADLDAFERMVARGAFSELNVRAACAPPLARLHRAALRVPRLTLGNVAPAEACALFADAPSNGALRDLYLAFGEGAGAGGALGPWRALGARLARWPALRAVHLSGAVYGVDCARFAAACPGLRVTSKPLPPPPPSAPSTWLRWFVREVIGMTG